MCAGLDAPWLARGIDWETTAVGPMSTWPEALVGALGVIRASRFPMVIAWGPSRSTFYNQAFAPILSGKAEALGRPLDEVFAESWDAIGGAFVRAEGGESVYFEDLPVPLIRDGQTQQTWWTFSHSPLLTPSGHIGGVLCVVFETTRARLAEKRERIGQEELKRITDIVPSLLWRADRFGRTVWQSGRLQTLASDHGADSSTLWKRLVHPDDLDAVLEELAEAKAERRAFARQLRLKVSPTQYRWHQARSEPIFDDAGGLTGWCGVATDVQDSRSAVEALGDREALFGQFAAHSASLLWTLDVDTLQIERLSRNFDALWPRLTPSGPWTWTEFIGSVHESDRAGVQEGFARATRGETVHGRFRVSTVSKGLRLLESTTFPILDAEGKVVCLGGILKDVTPEYRRVTHLIDADAGSQNRLWHGLRGAGFEVKTFALVKDFARTAATAQRGPVLYRHHGSSTELEQLAELVRSMMPGTPWLVIQSHCQSARDAIDIMKSGASDVIEADASLEAIPAALATAASLIRATPTDTGNAASAIAQLTLRERQVLQGIVAGGTNKSIGLALNLSPRTVESHRSRLMERLHVRTLAELVALATQSSALRPGSG